ncbi:MAG TPA: LysR family transcriptional regulator [Albitalea sp.]|nr:LysR family transcriptional regulator [Albitalea sp.]
MVSVSETIDLQELRAFVEVAHRLGVTAAARSLGVPKSVVSKNLSSLETLLKVRLFERSSRRVALTREGQALLPRAESILAELDRLTGEAQHEFVHAAGTVRIAAPPEFGTLVVAQLVPPLLAEHPQLQVAMQLEYAHTDLLDPIFDLAFRVGSVHDERLVARPLGQFHRVLVASPAFAAAHPLAAPEALGEVDCLVFSDRELAGDWTLRRADAKGRPRDVRVKARLAVRGFTALLAAAEAGLGVARLPTFAAQIALERGDVVRVLPDWHSPPATVYLVHRFGVERIGRIRAVIEAARAYLVPLLDPIDE